MKRILPIFLAVCLMLAGCGEKNAPETTESIPETTIVETTVPETTVPETTVPETTAVPETTQAQTAAAPSPLTGLPGETALNARPYAVVINNIVDAMPQCGIRDAELVYEVLAEGGVTRCLAIFRDPAKTGPIGSVRSARPYLADLAMAYDAVFVHAGGSEAGYAKIRDHGLDHLDGVRGPSASKYYYRDQDRLSSGYNVEHTMFLTGEKMMQYAADRDFELTREENLDYGLKFAEKGLERGAEAKTVTVDFANSSKTTYLEYQEDTGLYAATQYKRPYVDGSTGDQMTFRNVIVITAGTHYDDKGYRLEIDLVDSGEGWFICDGKMVPILWSREGTHEPFVYTLEDGTPLTLGRGRTYIAVTPRGSKVICE